MYTPIMCFQQANENHVKTPYKEDRNKKKMQKVKLGSREDYGFAPISKRVLTSHHHKHTL